MSTKNAQNLHGTAEAAKAVETRRQMAVDLSPVWCRWIDLQKRLLVKRTLSVVRSRLNRLKNPSKNLYTVEGNIKELRLLLEKEAKEGTTLPADFTIDEHCFFAGPPIPEADTLLVSASIGADLAGVAAPSPAVSRHLGAYVIALKSKINKAHGNGHITAERQLIDTKAMTFEELRSWHHAANELRQLIELDLKLEDYAIAVRNLLRRGIALYQCGRFPEARDVLIEAETLIEKRLPKYGEIRTTVKIWDYLGLTLLRCGDAQQAIEWLSKADKLPHEKQLATPLASASRLVRKGIAYMELNDTDNARKHLFRGLAIRVKLCVLSELSRGLRYVGLLHFQLQEWRQALCIWDLCESVQDAFDDNAERAKLRYYRAELFRRWSTREGDPIGESILLPNFEELFPTVEERALLKPLITKFQPRQEYLRADAAAAARLNFEGCIDITCETSNRSGLAAWRTLAENGLKALNHIGTV